ncbi:MFS transporter [Mycolicibacterium brumae]|uniref:MFS transporter n=1 Tax=Mycolicibacterium brumae TaxID=85968 RepID=A0A2G5PCN3_9MYCO|nr:MFS transporter [Mycolicibacterium brumae]MCV7191410.1 MFS transporter [Mycolicibacterium brumae]PIB75773.1 MFS transporter [Mycolicibacterium brumae]RWA16122.1 hypothetical protein MBRU_08415 [Mycolicibacterium brumae DSM 44177]UWW09482.1 MFS transporter [Mycolicibacterium brumae]
MTGPKRSRVGARRSDVVAWALWDCGSTGLNAIVITFVFSVCLTNTVGANLEGTTSPASWLGRALTIAGITVAVLAPATGVWVQNPRRRRTVLTVLTLAAVSLTASMSLIHADASYLFAGLALLAATAAVSDLASVPYNAMLRQLATPQTAGRVSGFGWAAGYLGSVALLFVIYWLFVSGSGETRGLLQIPTADGANIRAAMPAAAGWFAVFGLPLLLRANRIAPESFTPPEHVGVLGAYRQVWADLVSEWRRDPNLVRFLLASAVYRDRLVGAFTFGAVLGVNVYGLSAADVLMFGVAASVMAALGAAVGGLADDRVGAKPVIVGSLFAMVVVATVLLVVSGPAMFWAFGLVLCLFIGPIQSASRTLLRMAGADREGVAFGLYTMTGRAVAFLAPWMFSLFVDVFDSVRAGLGGLGVVLVSGLELMLFVRTPSRKTV